ncbi:Holliday junction branch migration protein RuvA [Gimesia aquarii]|uniref:Holliday junction branch migration complex subunit RuvA n=1 Tax=Gimesia aquarii TaxID=2527964 RepID=A0A517WU68_9PLAN|nr:Holliday junction branch migration protein RuvA [Gimesia aquarii]QDU08794.1 Holliday junction ATP-dependent DNA helicase RuvA [Gimesia aquarii]
MITNIRGELVELNLTEAIISVGAFDYQVFIPEFVRRQLQSLIGQEVSLKTIQYIEGNPQKGRLTPRLIGFMNHAEKEFFELVCSVDGVGVKKTLRAMVRPVKEVATAIEENDLKQLTTLPGIGPAVAERIVAKLRRKMTKFALIIAKEFPADEQSPDVFGEAYEALLSLGYSATEARTKVETIASEGKKFKNIEDFLTALYQQERG